MWCGANEVNTRPSRKSILVLRLREPGAQLDTVLGGGRRAAPSAPGCGAKKASKDEKIEGMGRIPSPDAALGDGLTRSASLPTI
ncbi:MAG TPA: hypothetical protein VFF11_09855, partial [Candidatus Binatia bacterium]|nr:hypothetical protein [Candidatus Binatia bacterium]